LCVRLSTGTGLGKRLGRCLRLGCSAGTCLGVCLRVGYRFGTGLGQCLNVGLGVRLRLGNGLGRRLGIGTRSLGRAQKHAHVQAVQKLLCLIRNRLGLGCSLSSGLGRRLCHGHDVGKERLVLLLGEGWHQEPHRQSHDQQHSSQRSTHHTHLLFPHPREILPL